MVKFDTRNLKNLNANDFLGKSEKYFIIPTINGDCATEEKRVSASGKEYSVYTLHVQQDNGMLEKQIPFLFERDLQDLIMAYGEDSRAWSGCLVVISAEKQGNFNNWILKSVAKK